MFRVQWHGRDSAVLVAVKSMLSRSSTTVSISTTEPEPLRTLFTPEETEADRFRFSREGGAERPIARRWPSACHGRRSRRHGNQEHDGRSGAIMTHGLTKMTFVNEEEE
jgi:hypothetical protein